MKPSTRELNALGFIFDPFEHLDSAQDAHLQKYLVIPKTIEVVLSDQPIAIFARPGGGKSALRIYASNFYKDSRGVRFPISYIPETYNLQPDFHFKSIRGALARAAFMYLASYPDLFFDLPAEERQQLKGLFQELPFGLQFNLTLLRETRFLSDLEQTLGSQAFSTSAALTPAHKRLADELHALPSYYQSAPLTDCFALLKSAFGARSIHLLVDGLDSFMETQSSPAVLTWVTPLLSAVEPWKNENVYLKFFLPLDISDTPALKETPSLRATALTWDDNLLAQVIRRRVFVASGGSFDSLDAISTPDVRNVELTLARQLGEKEKLPRQIILKCYNLLHKVVRSHRTEILPEDLFSTQELSYDPAI